MIELMNEAILLWNVNLEAFKDMLIWSMKG